MTNTYLDTTNFGPMILFAIRPNMYDDNNVEQAKPVGFKYGVVLPEQDYEKLYVKIPGPQILEAPLSGHGPQVEFTDLQVKPYVESKTARMAFTSTATGIKVVDATGTSTATGVKVVDTTGAGKTQAKG